MQRKGKHSLRELKTERMRARTSLILFLSLFSLTPGSAAFSFPGGSGVDSSKQANTIQSEKRRASLQRFGSLIAGTTTALLMSNNRPAYASLGDVTVVVQQPGDRVGLELMDVVIGTPPRTVVAIRRNVAGKSQLQTGLILRDFNSAAQVQERLVNGPYPVQLVFYNLAAQGDAISDLGTPMVTAQDALDLARRTSAEASMSTTTSTTAAADSYSKTILSSSTCNIQSRRLDVLEIKYEARINSPTDGVIYDSSEFRGTGRPYQMVLGSGDMLPGVDQGLYDMCPGDVRLLQIPPRLAYGSRGNKLFRIPPDATLYWKVKLVSVNSVRQGDPRTRDEMEGRAEYQSS